MEWAATGCPFLWDKCSKKYNVLNKIINRYELGNVVNKTLKNVFKRLENLSFLC